MLTVSVTVCVTVSVTVFVAVFVCVAVTVCVAVEVWVRVAVVVSVFVETDDRYCVCVPVLYRVCVAVSVEMSVTCLTMVTRAVGVGARLGAGTDDAAVLMAGTFEHPIASIPSPTASIRVLIRIDRGYSSTRTKVQVLAVRRIGPRPAPSTTPTT